MATRPFELTIPLPSDEKIPARAVRNLHPWLRDLLSQESVKSILKSRWSGVPGWLQPLRDRILGTGMPHLVVTEAVAYLGLVLGAKGRHRPFTERDEDAWFWTMYVSPPIRQEAAMSSLRRCGLERHDDVREFVLSFDNLRESEPGISGGFMAIREWHEFEEDDVMDYFPDEVRREWANALVFFDARNGDQFLLHPSGPVGVMLHEEARVESRWKSFREFIVQYADYLENRWPLDGYGPSKKALAARRERERRRPH